MDRPKPGPFLLAVSGLGTRLDTYIQTYRDTVSVVHVYVGLAQARPNYWAHNMITTVAKLEYATCFTVDRRPARRQKCGQSCSAVKRWCSDNVCRCK